MTFILLLYRYQYVPARIDSDGYAYLGFNHGWRWYENLGGAWYDDNEYDLLVERHAKKIEILELDYEEVLYNETKKYEEPEELNSERSRIVHSNCKFNKTSMIRTTLSSSSTEDKTWTHSVQFGILRSSKITVNFIACIVEYKAALEETDVM